VKLGLNIKMEGNFFVLFPQYHLTNSMELSSSSETASRLASKKFSWLPYLQEHRTAPYPESD
jgi:hypothetical protein